MLADVDNICSNDDLMSAFRRLKRAGEAAFIKSKPGLSQGLIEIGHARSRLTEVRLRLSKDLQFRDCPFTEPAIRNRASDCSAGNKPHLAFRGTSAHVRFWHKADIGTVTEPLGSMALNNSTFLRLAQ